MIRSDSRRTRLGAKLATVRPLHTSEVDPAQQVVDTTAAHDVVSAALDDLSESDAESCCACGPGSSWSRRRSPKSWVLTGHGPDAHAPSPGADFARRWFSAASAAPESTATGRSDHRTRAIPHDTLTTPNGSEATR